MLQTHNKEIIQFIQKIILVHVEIINLTFKILMNFLLAFPKSKVIYYLFMVPLFR